MTLAKKEQMRFVGHLDLHRTLERTIRRARLPLAHTQGFSPHPRIILAAALPLGCTSEADLADVWLEENLEPADIFRLLREAEPPGLHIEDVTRVPEEDPSLPAQVIASEYEAHLGREVSYDGLRQAALQLLASAEIPRTRRDRPYDLRPLVLAMEVLPVAPEGTVVWMQLAAKEGATGRPDEVLNAMGISMAEARIVRCRLLLGSQNVTTKALDA
jgi:radical SAM-linked protein